MAKSYSQASIALADALIALSNARGDHFPKGDHASRTYEDKKSAWLAQIYHAFDTESGIKVNGIALGASDKDMTEDFKATLLEAFEVIDARNVGKVGDAVSKVDEDVVRALIWNKTDFDLRYDLTQISSFESSIMGLGASRMMLLDTRPDKIGAPSFLQRTALLSGFASRPSPYAQLLGLKGLVIDRVNKRTGAPDGVGNLGGLGDLSPRDRPIDEEFIARITKLATEGRNIPPSDQEKFIETFSAQLKQKLGRVILENHILGKTPQDVAAFVESRVGQEFLQGINTSLDLTIADVVLGGRMDNLIARSGVFAKADVTKPEGRRATGMRSSRDEIAEELVELLEYLKADIQGINLDPGMESVRIQLAEQLENIISLVNEAKKSEIHRAVKDGRVAQDGRKAKLEDLTALNAVDPASSELRQINLTGTKDYGFFYSVWKPKSIQDAVNPPEGTATVRLVGPECFRVMLKDTMFWAVSKAGKLGKDIADKIKAVKNAPQGSVIALLQQRIAKKELRGLRDEELVVLCASYGKKGGEYLNPDNGDDLDVCMRYAHECWAYWDEAIYRWENGPFFRKGKDSLQDYLVAFVEEMTENICEASLAANLPHEAYNPDIINMFRMMAGSRLKTLKSLQEQERLKGLKPGTVKAMQEAGERTFLKIMSAHGHNLQPTSVYKDAFGPKPYIPGISKELPPERPYTPVNSL